MIDNSTAKQQYSYTSGVTQFQNAPVIFNDTELQVIYTGASGLELTLTLTADYTVSQVGTSFSSSIVTLTATGIAKLDAVGGSVPVTVQRVIPATQEIDYISMTNFPAENTENGLDKLTLLLAQGNEGVVPLDTKSLKFPTNDSDSLSPIIPKAEDRAQKFLTFDAQGEPTVTSLSSGAVGGMTGPSPQGEGNLAIFDATEGVLKQNDDIAESLFLQQTLDWATFGLSTTVWDSDLGHIATVTAVNAVTKTPTVNVTNIKPGKYSLILIQDVAGGAEPQWGAMFEGSPIINTAGSAITTIEFISDGTKLYAVGTSATSGKDDTGSIKPFAYDFSGDENNVGYLYCNGQAVSRETYANLFAKIGTTYGIGDGSTTFDLPNYEDEFLRGSDGVRTAGDVQADATAVNGLAVATSLTTNGDHSHSYVGDDQIQTALGGIGSHQGSTGDLYDAISGNSFPIQVTTDVADGHTHNVVLNPVDTNSQEYATATDGDHSHTATSTPSGDSETRPRNVAVFYGIRF